MIKSEYGEKWKDVDFGDQVTPRVKYKISNFGRVIKIKEGKEMLFEVRHLVNGYPSFGVTQRTRKTTSKYVHRLVAEYFLERGPDQEYVIHLDYDKENNKVYNLKWATHEEKTLHNRKSPFGPHKSKLTEAKVRVLKKKLLDPNRKTRMKILAKQFGVSEMQLYRIKSGENWGYVEVDV